MTNAWSQSQIETIAGINIMILHITSGVYNFKSWFNIIYTSCLCIRIFINNYGTEHKLSISSQSIMHIKYFQNHCKEYVLYVYGLGLCGVNINARVTTFSENTSSNCCVREKVFEKKVSFINMIIENTGLVFQYTYNRNKSRVIDERWPA